MADAARFLLRRRPFGAKHQRDAAVAGPPAAPPCLCRWARAHLAQRGVGRVRHWPFGLPQADAPTWWVRAASSVPRRRAACCVLRRLVEQRAEPRSAPAGWHAAEHAVLRRRAAQREALRNAVPPHAAAKLRRVAPAVRYAVRPVQRSEAAALRYAAPALPYVAGPAPRSEVAARPCAEGQQAPDAARERVRHGGPAARPVEDAVALPRQLQSPLWSGARLPSALRRCSVTCPKLRLHPWIANVVFDHLFRSPPRRLIATDSHATCRVVPIARRL